MKKYNIWDPLLRVFHWALVAGFVANALLLEDDGSAHQLVGYIILGLLVFRLVWGFAGSRYARFSSFMPTVGTIQGQISDMAAGRARVHLGHTPLGALMIWNIVVTLLAISATGYMLTISGYSGADWVEEAHEALVVWAEISVVAHIVAVIWESVRTGVNLPRAMVTGVKTVPSEATIVE
jgi:cytochrome b